MEDIVRAATDWCWETDRQGNFTYLDAPDAALRPDGLNGLAGMNLFDWLPDSPAFDAVRLAYLRHAPFRAQTVHIERGAAAGIWSLAGVPVFEDASGQFQGYRGTAIAVPSELAHRVPSAVASKSPDSGADDDSSVDRMYMLAHELRSPLNAILGFAQMIEREALGAVGDDYRAQAGGILNAGGRLLHLVEEFLEAARTPDSEVAQPCALNAPVFVGDVVDSLSDHARHAGVYLISRVSTAVRTITAEPQGLRRALSRAILKMIDIAGRDQTVIVSAQVEPGDRVRLIVHCPVLAASLEATTESGDFSCICCASRPNGPVPPSRSTRTACRSWRPQAATTRPRRSQKRRLNAAFVAAAFAWRAQALYRAHLLQNESSAWHIAGEG
ncbi:hypothetical protein E6W36_09035 [Hankyongella ginsenosidimutans]|uniref:histidine kinase n=1 Tax=Hankyongella ginsenosidimutans TaxID=1763828 RepID=A0A4D7CC36_9SPHN|nr:histidine kinase dimerization/phospho-acceptor domain-containing protein [Hankyongella ginsenosidimutans]QCI79632.1 hypothetical protein E6W36_09035 [Hankyongella ginsenosidimutans]